VECPVGNFSLTVNRNIDAGGTLSNYGGDCYAPGTPATVSVTSITPDYWFTGWSGASTSTSRTITLTMNSNQALTANFKAITYYTITTNALPAGAGTVVRNPDLPRYPDTITQRVSIHAVPNTGYGFTGWSGTSTSANPIIWTKDGNLALTANFQQTIMGTVTDSRNGQTYRTVKIGNGKTWMAENLNYETSDSWCYGEGGPVWDDKINKIDKRITLSNAEVQANCTKYGRLYTWDAAMSACPSGWSLPDTADWRALVRVAGGSEMAVTKLKAKSPDWDGTDELGFSALPGGDRSASGTFYRAGSNCNWWSATEHWSWSDNAYNRSIYSNNADNAYSVGENWNDKGWGFSARCVR